MKCPECGGYGKVGEYNYYGTCPQCGGSGEVEMTEQEWLQTANTEQLAEWICSLCEKCYYCGAKNISDRDDCPFGDGKCRNNKHEIEMWLKEIHECA